MKFWAVVFFFAPILLVAKDDPIVIPIFIGLVVLCALFLPRKPPERPPPRPIYGRDE